MESESSLSCYKSPPLGHILNQFNPIDALTSYLFKIHLLLLLL
jgi:hypothetical protein